MGGGVGVQWRLDVEFLLFLTVRRLIPSYDAINHEDTRVMNNTSISVLLQFPACGYPLSVLYARSNGKGVTEPFTTSARLLRQRKISCK